MTAARDVRDRYTAAFDAHDVEALLRTVNPAVVTVSPEGVTQGRDELAAYLEQFWEAFPDVRTVITETFDVGDTTFDELLMVGTHTGPYTLPDGEVISGTNRRIAVRSCYICTVENDLVVSLRVYFDQLELLTQLRGSTGLPH
ncbi:ester cyclase [Microbispora sp. NPDC049633]|uniref:ester cyclase n=1 Tax=Microbispora sp. NPDC049633 TaxID=3154355 RepID=UPI00343E098C